MYKTKRFRYYTSFTDYLNTHNILKEDIINVSVISDGGHECIILVYWDNESED